MASDKISVLSFNVFPGPPLPNNKLTSLYGTRLKQQISIIKYYLPDIICLQELYCVDSLEIYKKTFSKTHNIIYNTVNNRLGLIISYLIHILTTILMCSFLSLFINLNMLINYIISTYATYYIFNNSPLISWLSSDTNGLVTMINKNITIVNCEYFTYKCQSGDILNNISTRAYCKINILINGYPMCIINTHLNALGSHEYQIKQLEELASGIDAGVYIICGDFNCDHNTTGINKFRQLANVKYTTQDTQLITWDNKNILTKGYSQSPNALYDYIFYKNIILLNKRLLLNEKPYCSDHFGTYAQFKNNIQFANN